MTLLFVAALVGLAAVFAEQRLRAQAREKARRFVRAVAGSIRGPG